MAVPKSNSFCYKFNKWINFFTGITLAQEIQANSPSTLLKDFKTTLHSDISNAWQIIVLTLIFDF